jgi:hypothetical protein
MNVTPICHATCPECLQPTGRFLPGVSGEAWVYAYQCDDCALVWKSDKRTSRHGSNTGDVVSWCRVTEAQRITSGLEAPGDKQRCKTLEFPTKSGNKIQLGAATLPKE